MENVSEQELAILRDAFKALDKNNDGNISMEELREMLIGVGENPTEQQLKVMMNAVDLDGSGGIDINEFIVLMTKQYRDVDWKTKYDKQLNEKIFHLFGKDKTGLISSKQLKHVLQKLNINCSDFECDEMIADVDGDGDGFIIYEEFMQLMEKTNYK